VELEFTDDQDELRDGVRAVLDRECPMSLVRAVVEDGATTGRSLAHGLWRQMVDLGWPALTVPEEHGGLGLGAVELAVVAEELGRVVAPTAFVPTVSQFVPIVREAGSEGQQAAFLGAVAAGECTGALALVEAGGSVDPADVTTTATRAGDGWTLGGSKRAVLGAAEVDELAVVARVEGTTGDDGVAVLVVPREVVSLEPVASLDATRSLAHVSFDGVTVTADRMLGEPGPSTARAVRRAVEEATVILAMEAVGTCQSIFDVTLDYAKQREQFGVPIGSFQAIKHKFADMLLAIERARATGYFAALTIAEDDPQRTTATSVAKVAAGDCQRLLGKEGIQLHGGIGYTWEHDMHLYVRRAKSCTLLFGTPMEHRERIARLLGL
jgi:alkylation response protein AidB-like acyl-CoA dehydrogenase